MPPVISAFAIPAPMPAHNHGTRVGRKGGQNVGPDMMMRWRRKAEHFVWRRR